MGQVGFVHAAELSDLFGEVVLSEKLDDVLQLQKKEAADSTLKSMGILVQQRTTPAKGKVSMNGTAWGPRETWTESDETGRHLEGVNAVDH